MLAGEYNIRCDQGATLRRVISVTQPGASGDQPVDLTGYSAALTVRLKYGGTAILELTDGDGLTFGDGLIILYVPASVTATLTRSGVYDLEIRAPGGDVYKLIRGKFILRPEVTT